MNQIRRNTEAKDLRMSGNLVMTKDQWLARGATYRGSLGSAARSGYYTARACAKMGRSVSESEMAACTDFAMMASCYTDFLLVVDGMRQRPCLPVFFRGKKEEKELCST